MDTILHTSLTCTLLCMYRFCIYYYCNMLSFEISAFVPQYKHFILSSIMDHLKKKKNSKAVSKKTLYFFFIMGMIEGTVGTQQQYRILSIGLRCKRTEAFALAPV